MTLKNRGRSKKTEGRTRPKSKGGSLVVGTYLQSGSAPPGPGHSHKTQPLVIYTEHIPIYLRPVTITTLHSQAIHNL